MTTDPDFVISHYANNEALVLRRIAGEWRYIETCVTVDDAIARIQALSPMGAIVRMRMLDKNYDWHIEEFAV